MSAPARVPLFDLKRQYAELADELRNRLDVFLPTQMLTGGPELDQFEAHAAAYLEVPHAIAISNGTDALLVPLMSLNLEPGDEVIVPAFTFYCSASVIARVGAKPVFVDIDPATFQINPAAARAAITSRTRAIIGVHLFGQPFDVDALLALCREKNLVLIEDTAQAFGSKWKEKPLGGFGDFGSFSFYPTKNMGAMGEGGMITTCDAARARLIRALRTHGSEKRYHHFAMGGNFRLASIQALTLDVKLKYVNRWIENRRSNAAFYRDLFQNIDDLLLPVEQEHGYHTYNQFCILTSQRDALRNHLEAAGVGTDIYYPMPVPAQESFAYLGHKAGEFPASEKASAEILALPIFPELTEAELEQTASAVRSFFKL